MKSAIRFSALVLCLVLVSSFCIPAMATQTQTEGQAKDISGVGLVTDMVGFHSAYKLFDHKLIESYYVGRNASLTLEHTEGMGSLYFIFDLEYGAYTVTNNDSGEVRTYGETGLLHEFIDLVAAFGSAPKSVTVTFGDNELYVNELYVFTEGQVPDFVQQWDLPRENETDLILFSTHGDDEQLFFAGVLPYYARELDYEVLVVYLTNHRNLTRERAHEMLNGLWAVGVTTYPIFGHFPDFHIKSITGAYSIFSNMGYSEEDLTAYVVENIRRFKPKVAIGHDPLGEYSHGQHMVYSDVLQKAVQNTMNGDYYPESAEKYGVWDVPKTYLHLYTENQIYMDWDQPLESFDGMTAFEVTKNLGFPCHASQFVDFAWYMSYVESAAKVPHYSPCEYGLFRTTVGEDVQKNDFFENVLTYEQEAQKAIEEEAARAEAERLAQEEAERQAREEEAARQAQEAAEAAEAERKAQLEEQSAKLQKQKVMLLVCAAAAFAAAAGIVVLIVLLVKKR